MYGLSDLLEMLTRRFLHKASVVYCTPPTTPPPPPQRHDQTQIGTHALIDTVLPNHALQIHNNAASSLEYL